MLENTGLKTIEKLQILQILNANQKKSKQCNKTRQNKTTLVQSLLTSLSQEIMWAYSTMLPYPWPVSEETLRG